jgi:hypothetical protein
MNPRTLRLAGRVVVAGVLGLAVLTPAAVLAADPAPVAVASNTPSDQPSTAPSASDGGIAVDPTFITSPTPTPTGRVLDATGRPGTTPPATEAVGSVSSTGPDAPSLVLLLLGVATATIILVAACLPDVRRR